MEGASRTELRAGSYSSKPEAPPVAALEPEPGCHRGHRSLLLSQLMPQDADVAQDAASGSESDWSVPSWVPNPRSSSSPKEEVLISDSEDLLTLISATDAGRDDIVAKLLAGRADPDARNTDSETALHRAAYWARQDIVQLLLQYNADPSARDKRGKTPMRKFYDNPGNAVAFLDAGADRKALDEVGRNTLHRSAEDGHVVDVIEALLKAGADPRVGDLEEEEEMPVHEVGSIANLDVDESMFAAME